MGGVKSTAKGSVPLDAINREESLPHVNQAETHHPAESMQTQGVMNDDAERTQAGAPTAPTSRRISQRLLRRRSAVTEPSQTTQQPEYAAQSSNSRKNSSSTKQKSGKPNSPTRERPYAVIRPVESIKAGNGDEATSHESSENDDDDDDTNMEDASVSIESTSSETTDESSGSEYSGDSFKRANRSYLRSLDRYDRLKKKSQSIALNDAISASNKRRKTNQGKSITVSKRRQVRHPINRRKPKQNDVSTSGPINEGESIAVGKRRQAIRPSSSRQSKQTDTPTSAPSTSHTTTPDTLRRSGRSRKPSRLALESDLNIETDHTRALRQALGVGRGLLIPAVGACTDMSTAPFPVSDSDPEVIQIRAACMLQLRDWVYNTQNLVVPSPTSPGKAQEEELRALVTRGRFVATNLSGRLRNLVDAAETDDAGKGKDKVNMQAKLEEQDVVDHARNFVIDTTKFVRGDEMQGGVDLEVGEGERARQEAVRDEMEDLGLEDEDVESDVMIELGKP
ncbi:MAG: hypothetical protein Q9159_005660 [Coniocarpon cinnabarinum]